MKSFLVGLGLGIAAGVLFAPASGEQTRNDLRARAGEAVNTGRRKFGEVIDAGRETAGEISRRAQRAVESLKQEAGQERGA